MSFYKLKKDEKDNYLIDGKIITEKCITLADPTYDLTFKYLFSQSSWEKRTISLLKSLNIQEDITKIEVLNSEFVEPNLTSNKQGEPLRNLRSDLVFQLNTKDKNGYQYIELINIEMELKYPTNFLERLIEYGIVLKKRHEKGEANIPVKTLVLGFINYKGMYNMGSKSYSLSEFSLEKNQFIKKVDDFLDIIVINLKEISSKLCNNEKIFILGKEISTTGKNWLKLLSLRHWAKNNGKNKFEIPDFQVNEEISSAFNYLKQSNIELETIYDVEEEYLTSINKATLEEAKVLTDVEEEYLASIKKAALEEAKVLVEEEAKVLAEEEAKVLAEEKLSDEKLKLFIELYKNMDGFRLEVLEKVHGFNFSDVCMNKVIEYWGKNDEKSEKLEYLKNYIGKKRKILSPNKNEI
jgi:hypothetical protein